MLKWNDIGATAMALVNHMLVNHMLVNHMLVNHMLVNHMLQLESIFTQIHGKKKQDLICYEF